MKLKIVVVDFEIPMRVKKWAIRAGIPAVILAAAAVAWAAPLHTWSTGDTLNASDLNGNFTTLQAAIPRVTEWQTFTPTVADANNGNPEGISATGVYRRVGDSIEVQCELTNPEGTTTGNAMAVSFPPTNLLMDGSKVATYDAVGFAHYYHGGVNNICQVRVGSAGVSVLIDCAAGEVTPSGMATTDAIDLRYVAPISGWTATTP